MNEELNNALIQFVQSITEAAQKAGEFGAQQLPDVIEQLLMWELIRSAAICAVGLAMVYFAVKMIVYISTTLKDKLEEEREARISKSIKDGTFNHYQYALNHDGLLESPGFWLRLIPSIPLIIIGGLFINIQWLKILIAPKVWLIEYAADLIK